MKNNSYISFVVAIYNVETFLIECIESILRQEGNFELVLVDDGSTDSSSIICDEYAKKYSCVKVIHQKNKGLSDARNTGIINAIGSWICFIDGDDWIDANTTQTLFEYTTSDVDIIFYTYKKVNRNRVYLETIGREGPLYLYKDSFKMLQKDILDTGIKNRVPIKSRTFAWCKLYNRKFIYDNNLFFDINLKTGEDILFNFKAYQYANKGIYIDKALHNYRYFAGSATNRYRANYGAYLEKLVIELVNFIDLHQESKAFEESLAHRKLLSVGQFCLSDCCHPDNRRNYKYRKSDFENKIENIYFAKLTYKINFKDYGFEKRVLVELLKRKRFLIIDILIKLRFIMKKSLGV